MKTQRKFLTLEGEQINYSAQNPGEIDFSMLQLSEKSQGFNIFSHTIGTVWESRMKCLKSCQAPVQNVTEDISVHPNMFFQLCLQKTSLSQEVLKE